MNRCFSVVIVILVAMIAPLKAAAQSGSRVATVAYVFLFSEGPSAPFPAAFRGRLSELGWVEGRNIRVDVYDAGGSPEKLAVIMQRLVEDKVDVIVGACTPEAKAALRVTRSIPIVMAATGDPVAAGLVDSLARPGGNVTGVSGMLLELSAKRLELLKVAFPAVARATVVFNPERPDNPPEVRAMQVAASKLAIKLDSMNVRTRTELAEALDFMSVGATQALLNVGDPLLSNQAQVLVDFAASRRLPALYENREFVDKGGLMSYGPNFPSLHRRAADYVDKILKGAKPADLPIEQPTKFELVVNLRTAKKLGFTIPQLLLLRADEVIQ